MEIAASKRKLSSILAICADSSPRPFERNQVKNAYLTRSL